MTAASTFIPVALAAALIAPAGVPDDPALQSRLRELAASSPGTAGISVVHIESGVSASVNGDVRFPMMSVYKLPIVIHALRDADAGRLLLTEAVTLTAVDRRPGHSPLGENIAAHGPMRTTVETLIAAVVTTSDRAAYEWGVARK